MSSIQYLCDSNKGIELDDIITSLEQPIKPEDIPQATITDTSNDDERIHNPFYKGDARGNYFSFSEYCARVSEEKKHEKYMEEQHKQESIITANQRSLDMHKKELMHEEELNEIEPNIEEPIYNISNRNNKVTFTKVNTNVINEEEHEYEHDSNDKEEIEYNNNNGSNSSNHNDDTTVDDTIAAGDKTGNPSKVDKTPKTGTFDIRYAFGVAIVVFLLIAGICIKVLGKKKM